MSEVIFVRFYVDSDDDDARVAELIHHLPSSVTSVHVPDSHRLPAIQRETPLFINDYRRSNKIETFLHDNQLQLARTGCTHLFIDTGYRTITGPARLEFRRSCKIAVSILGPPSGNLILVLTPSSCDAAVTFILKEPHGSRTFEYPVQSSLTPIHITLFARPSGHPSIVPNTRNNLIIEVTGM
jgi:hypothetical protein